MQKQNMRKLIVDGVYGENRMNCVIVISILRSTYIIIQLSAEVNCCQWPSLYNNDLCPVCTTLSVDAFTMNASLLCLWLFFITCNYRYLYYHSLTVSTVDRALD